MEDEFEPTWQALYENGSSRKNRDATKRFWDTLTPEQQHRAFLRITRKVKNNDFVQFDPIRAIKENIRKKRVADERQPENLNFTSKFDKLIKEVPVVSAKYQDAHGVYTLAEALEFHLDINYGMNFEWDIYKQSGKIVPKNVD